MLGEFEAINNTDENGNPTGGSAKGVGLDIQWQDGPLGRGEDRQEPNGAFVETVIAVAEQRIQFYQDNGFACDENARAIEHLQFALKCLNARTARREREGTEGTHEGQ